ncbi:MAG TPA: helix-turn-helix transcriptional regulator [Thermoanaerobaculia bacterium]|nr:helix-turn-helix transcriptional regulator [Thermoanaerobaculia bacterium]
MRADRDIACAVGATLRGLRRKRGLTQPMLADLVGISRGGLATYEAGQHIPHLVILMRLLVALGCSWESFGRSLKHSSSPLEGVRR